MTDNVLAAKSIEFKFNDVASLSLSAELYIISMHALSLSTLKPVPGKSHSLDICSIDNTCGNFFCFFGTVNFIIGSLGIYFFLYKNLINEHTEDLIRETLFGFRPSLLRLIIYIWIVSLFISFNFVISLVFR